ncbi:hypothetical protein PRIPAC_89794 [Pristionchus pacificus]|uniref:F-box domain-containing protein n=1 Tax=Pristionchus pacificus TaxID=54126 RepID=A0A2A6B972_PRIPA|nr:hypothetical protein PRIPAC_89794 [Pristionchus pacificus]|eukprot:PDM62430.1 F-box domain-containing protein [Pristionchus pacificus]
MSQSTTSFLSLPSEIAMQIIEKLDQKDRMNLASVNKRFFKLDMMTGHRRFDFVQFKAENGGFIEVESGTKHQKFNRFTMIDKFSTFFNKATTKTLSITGRLEVMSERMLQILMNNIEFDKLIIDVVNYKSHRIIAFFSDESFIDDDLFIHLLSKTSGRTVIDCPNSTITKAALATVFEIVSIGSTKKEVISCVKEDGFLRYFQELYYHPIYEYNPVDGVFTGIYSRATAWFYKEDDDRMIIEMRPPQK